MEPFVEPDAAEARFAQRHERALLDPTAPVSGVRVAHDLARVADRLQITGDFVERRSFRTGDLDDPVSRRRERHLGDDGSNVVRGDGLEQAPGGSLTVFPSALASAMPRRNSMN